MPNVGFTFLCNDRATVTINSLNVGWLHIQRRYPVILAMLDQIIHPRHHVGDDGEFLFLHVNCFRLEKRYNAYQFKVHLLSYCAICVMHVYG